MTGPLDRPRWQALEIGPGGLPPSSVRPFGVDAPRPGSAQQDGDAPRPGSAQQNGDAPRPGWPSPPAQVPTNRADQQNRQYPTDLPPAWQQWTSAAASPAPARRRALQGPARKIAAAVAALCILTGLALWGNAARPLGSARGGQVGVGECLSATGRQIDGTVSCGDAAADFRVVGRYPDTADPGECSASPADLAVVQLGPTLLCLNYVAVTGDCLLLGHQAGEVGKVSCVPGTAGEYRVRAVLKNSISADDCPTGTTQTLVHQYNSEVVCLSRS
jgi:hypothetical protein